MDSLRSNLDQAVQRTNACFTTDMLNNVLFLSSKII